MKTESLQDKAVSLVSEALLLGVINEKQRPHLEKLAAMDDASFHNVRAILKDQRNVYALKYDELAESDKLGALYQEDTNTWKMLVKCKTYKATWI